MENWKKRWEEFMFTEDMIVGGDTVLNPKPETYGDFVNMLDDIEGFIEQEIEKAREESEEDEESYSRFSKCFLDGFSEGYDKSRRRALKEVLWKFDGSVIVGKIDGEWEWQEPELDVWLKEELGKLGEKDK